MVLIVGGFAAGKRDFAHSLGFANEDIFVLDCHDSDFAELTENPVILYQEMGCGLVPMDAGERARREKMGRLSVELASHATAVYRVTCGVGQRIK